MNSRKMPISKEDIQAMLNYDAIKKDNGCIDWVGRRKTHFRGCVYIDGRNYMVSRVVASVYYGLDLANDKMYVLHKCGNGRCVNPDHLYVSDNLSQNQYDSVKDNTHWNASKKLCKRGHEFDKVIYHKGSYERTCSKCQYLRNKKLT